MNLFKSLLSSIGVIFGIFIVNSIIAFNFTEAKEFCEFINYGCILGLAVVGIFAMVSKYIHDYGAIRGVLAFLGAIIFFVFLIGSIRDYNIGNREEAAATEYRRTNSPTEQLNTKMYAAQKRWHNYRAESLRLKREGKYGESEYQDGLANVAYDQYNMYYHLIEGQK